MLLAAALFLTGYNLLDEHRAGTDAEHALEELLVRTPETNPSAEEGAINRSEMAATEIEGEDYIGILEIPSLEIVLPVMAEWSDSNLKIAPCRYHGSAYSGDLVIAGHNYRTHFGALGSLTAGAQIVFTDIGGNRFLYEVAGIEVFGATDVEGLLSGGWDLTLFTCNYDGRARVTVRCIRAD